jgi:hypothetical protein
VTLSRRSALALPVAAYAAARELRCDVAVIGGGTGGCAAALAALREGMSVILTCDAPWVGGQLTAQMVPPDEHTWIESFGGTRLYRSFRRNVRAFYRQHYPLTADAMANELLNPGGGSVSALTHEPRVAVQVLEAMLQPFLSRGQLRLLELCTPIGAETEGSRLRAVTVRNQAGQTQVINAACFLDATEQGDLLPLAKAEYVTGFEARSRHNEPSAPEQAQPDNIQSFTLCFALGYEDGADHTIDRPAEYAFWRDYVPAMKPAWPGKLLSWTYSNPVTLEPRTAKFDPRELEGVAGPFNLWLYRRILDPRIFGSGNAARAVSLINWPQNDYWLGNLHNLKQPGDFDRHVNRARQLNLSLLYWMQTECPRLDGKQGWPGLHLRMDQSGTADGMAMYPYIRESRRIVAETTVVEQHVSTKLRPNQDRGEVFAESVGVGSYRIDLHPSSGGDNYVDVSSLPFEIPMGALIPQRVDNLLAASKNLGVTHITNGCYRLHPVEWNIGEAAGALAATAVKRRETPRAIRANAKAREDFQALLTRRGVELHWPRLLPR